MSTTEVILIVTVIVLAATLLIAALYRYSRKLIRTYLPTDPADFAILNRYAEGTDTILVGDSLTDFFPVHEFTPHTPLLNRGVAGETTRDVAARMEAILSLHPKKVFLLIGINDLIRERKLTAPTLAQRVMDLAGRFSPETELTVVSLYPVNRRKRKWSFLCCKHAYNAEINEVNRLLSAQCAEQGIRYLDVASALKDDKGDLKAEYSIEGLHLTIAGYEQVFGQLKPFLTASDATVAE